MQREDLKSRLREKTLSVNGSQFEQEPSSQHNKSLKKIQHYLQTVDKNQCQPRMFYPLELLKKWR